jgi:hypothetical protein
MNTARRLTGLSRRRRWTRDQIQVTDPEVLRRSIAGRRPPGSPPTVETEREARALAAGMDYKRPADDG